MSTKTRTTRKTSRTATTGTDRALRAVLEPAVAATRTAAEDSLWVALYDKPGATAAELALAAGIGKSTAAKILAAWAKDSSVTRTSGIAEGRRRTADRWTIADADTTASPTADMTMSAPPVEVADDAPETDTAVDSDAQPVAVDTKSGTATQNGNRAPRLASGGLRGLVEDFLRDHEGEEFSPSKIGKELGRSSGAVNNALEKLVETGYARKTNAAPKRFVLAISTGDADTTAR